MSSHTIPPVGSVMISLNFILFVCLSRGEFWLVPHPRGWGGDEEEGGAWAGGGQHRNSCCFSTGLCSYQSKGECQTSFHVTPKEPRSLTETQKKWFSWTHSFSSSSVPLALGCSRREEDQISGGSAGWDSDEEVGDQTETLWRARDHYGSRKRGCESVCLIEARSL